MKQQKCLPDNNTNHSSRKQAVLLSSCFRNSTNSRGNIKNQLRLENFIHPHKISRTNWTTTHSHYYDGTILIPERGEDHENTNKLAINDFVAGTFAGVASTAIGHPFDTIKLRLQIRCPQSTQFKGPLDCLLQTVRQEGVYGVYRGLSSPLTTVPLVNAIVFGSYGSAKTFFQSQKDNPNDPLTISESMYSGAWAGLVNCVIVSPVELIKCRLQAQGKAIESKCPHSVHYKGSVDCVRQILHKEGILGLYRGYFATMLREVPCYIGQFGTYEFLSSYLHDKNKEKPSTWTTLTSGGIAGCVCWAVSYPQDVVKSRIQLNMGPSMGIIKCFKDIVKEEGLRALWRGFSPCLLRAFPANAAGFFVYEAVKEQLINMDSI